MIFDARRRCWGVLLWAASTCACSQLFTFDEFSFDASRTLIDSGVSDRATPNDLSPDRAATDVVATDTPAPDAAAIDTPTPDATTPDAVEMDLVAPLDLAPSPDTTPTDELPGARDVSADETAAADLVTDTGALDVVVPDGAFCPVGLTSCDGICIDLSNDPTNCGHCDGACDVTHSNTRCVGGTCVPRCHVGWADCDGLASNGCETDLADRSHCSTCTMSCPNDRVCNAASGCVCPTGQFACPSGCHDLQSDPRNCGTCGLPCGAGFVCLTGRCTSSCPPKTVECAHACVDLNVNPLHCGECERPCANEHGTTTCAGGRCLPTCAAGWGDCDGEARNGCETDLTTNEHCGTCTRTCLAEQSCNDGVCERPCGPQQIDCGNMCFNRLTNHDHCGTCPNRCGDSQRCVNAACLSCYGEGVYCVAGRTICCGAMVCGPVTVPSAHYACCRLPDAACGAGSLCCAGLRCVAGHCT